MTVVSVFASLTLLFAVLVFGGFLLLRPPKCPRCGAREWVPLPHLGRYWAYCRKCLLFADLSKGPRP